MKATRVFVVLLAALGLSGPAHAQQGPLRIVIEDGVIEPIPFAAPVFVAETGDAGQAAADITRVIAADLAGTGLLREIPPAAFVSQVTSFDQPVAYPDWKAINAQALITGAVAMQGGTMVVKFRLFDIFSGQPMGDGLQFQGAPGDWRRIAHKVADQIYSRITGEGGYFDSQVVFVAESGPKNARLKALAMMDQDGANLRYLTDTSTIVLAPRFSPDGRRVLYTSYESGFPQIKVMDVGSLASQTLADIQGTMSFAPRFSPDGGLVVFSLAQDGNTDLYAMPVSGGRMTRLTDAPSIETSPSFSPDGSKIVFESDRSGTQQIYIMPVGGGEPVRISAGEGRYSTPVWSPRGDYIAFTKQNAGRFHIGVMRTDGTEERLLTASFLDEGPTWAPNGRVIMFTRETAGAAGQALMYSVDISGRNLRQVPTDGGASEPYWGPLRP
jgi:TolB protein